MSKTIYYISSNEYDIFDTVRKCTFLKKLHFNTGNECVLAEVEPPVIGQEYGFGGENFKYLILSQRHGDNPVFAISRFPCSVHVCFPTIDDIFEKKIITMDDLYHAVWGELYRTAHDAKFHIRD